MGERKYGIVSASDVKVGAVRGANMQSASHHMAMKRYQPIMSRSPMKRMPQSPWQGLGHTLTSAIVGAVQQVQAGRAATAQRGRAAAEPMHPAARSWGEVSSSSSPLGALTPKPDMPSADSYYRAPSGGMGARVKPEVDTTADPEPATEYYRPPGGMGAKVPASRLAKFSQGRGT